eukprot:gene1030-9934_t
MKPSIWKIRVLSLYRSILKIHKQKLTKEQLYLGNKYVQSEFKLHKTADKNQAEQFVREWDKYYKFLKEQETIVGKDLSEEEKESFSSEQHEKLAELKEEVSKLEEK